MSTESATTAASKLLEDLAHLPETEKIAHLVQAVAALEERELSFRRLWDVEKKETDRLQAAVEMRGTVIAQAQATISVLRAALKPFAELARTYRVETVEFNRPDDKTVFGLNDAKITVGALRAALKAIVEEA